MEANEIKSLVLLSLKQSRDNDIYYGKLIQESLSEETMDLKYHNLDMTGRQVVEFYNKRVMAYDECIIWLTGIEIILNYPNI
jgi:hypothetical protein